MQITKINNNSKNIKAAHIIMSGFLKLKSSSDKIWQVEFYLLSLVSPGG